MDKCVVGSTRHLVYTVDGDIRWSPEVPPDCLVYGPWVPPEQDLKLLLGLAATNIHDGPGEPWEGVMRTVMGADDAPIPWAKAMPSAAWESYVRRLCEALRAGLAEVGTDYYLNTYLPSQAILGALDFWAMDPAKKAQYIEEDGPTQVLESFVTTTPTKYSRLTSTGRLKVVEGPEILRLKKSQRDIIVSRYASGQVMSLDYVSLEPRLALALAGKPVPEDVYQDIIDNVLDGMDRKTAKKIVLSVLYGAGTKKLQETVELDAVTLSSYIMRLKKYFGIKELTRKLVAEQAEHGFIRNFYGKVIRLKNPVAHKLYNAYIQSTAVDICLLGFSKLKFTEGCGTDQEMGSRTHPIFVIHDALVVDCETGGTVDYEPAQTVPGFDTKFSIEMSPLYVSSWTPGHAS